MNLSCIISDILRYG